MDTAIAIVEAYALEGAFHFMELTFEVIRRSGVSVLVPEVFPFRSMPFADSAACSAAAVALVLRMPSAWRVFDVALAIQVASYLWIETGVDLVAVVVLFLLDPTVSQYSICASMLLVTVLMLQPRMTVSSALWKHSLFMCFLCSARLLSFVGYTMLATITLVFAIEVACQALCERVYGRSLCSATHIGFGFRTFVWYAFGVRLVDAAEWLKQVPIVESGLPIDLRGARLFCKSPLVRGVRFYTGRVIDTHTVAITIGEWDEVAFAPNVLGFALAVLASLRIPISLRARINCKQDTIIETKLILLFYELPSSIWYRLTSAYEPTDSVCMAKGTTILLPSRTTLRRITGSVLSWVLFNTRVSLASD